MESSPTLLTLYPQPLSSSIPKGRCQTKKPALKHYHQLNFKLCPFFLRFQDPVQDHTLHLVVVVSLVFSDLHMSLFS